MNAASPLRRRLMAAVTALMAGAVSVPALAGPHDHDHRGPGRGHGHGKHDKHYKKHHDRYDRHGYYNDRPRGKGPRHAAPHYAFRPADRDRLVRYYGPQLPPQAYGWRPYPGARMAPDYRRHLQPVPQQVLYELPPPPRGYRMGYYQGNAVVYDPVTSVVLSVLNLVR
ncbi:hypothetical protein [uncultured Xylophilus sp.]|uniref:hypothetical protein n=1 Tax=uncultured Xylophilus sp. TaxID=296832 RepID=UPI0025FDA386|nr:hypothetical protein [uncultured Xylophilus sp.]